MMPLIEAFPERLSPSCLFSPVWLSPFVVRGAFPEPHWARSSWFFSPVLSAVQDPGLGHMGVKVSWLFDQAISTPSVSSGANKLAPYFQDRSNGSRDFVFCSVPGTMCSRPEWPWEFSASHHNTLLQGGDTCQWEQLFGFQFFADAWTEANVRQCFTWWSAVRDGGRDVRVTFRSEQKPDAGWDVWTCCVVWLNAFLLLSSFSRL